MATRSRTHRMLRSRPPTGVHRIERLWGRLADLFAPPAPQDAATKLVLAPRRLESRRLLDAGAAGLALQIIDDPAYVQAAPSEPAAFDATETSASPQAVMANTPPSNLQFAPIAAINEGGVATLDLGFDDPDAGDSHTVEVDWGDGTPLEIFNVAAGSQFFGTTHQYLDDPAGVGTETFTVSVRVADAAGDDIFGAATATVHNLAPTNLVVPVMSDTLENGVATLNLSFDEPGPLDTHTVEVDWGDGSALEYFNVAPGANFFSTTHQYLDDNPTTTPSDTYTVKVRVIDDDGADVAGQTSVLVGNVAPSNVVLDPILNVSENGVATLQLTFDDPGTLDSHQVEVDWGDGSPVQFLSVAGGSRTFTASHQYLDDNPTGTASDAYTVTVRVHDDDSGVSAQASRTVTVLNVAPSAVVLAPPAAIAENGVATLQLTFDDPGSLDTQQVEIDWGDNSAPELLTVAAGTRFFSTTHQYLDDDPSVTSSDPYMIAVRVLDDDGGASATVQTTVTVNNVASSNVQLAPIATIDENGVATLQLTFDDPGSLDAHQVEINWGDGSAVETLTVAAGSRFFSTTHQYLDDNPTGTSQDNYTVSIRVLDDDSGASAAATTTVTVRNVAPNAVVIAPPAMIDENGVATLDLTFTDPGTLDAHQVEVDWGDGSAVEVLTVAAGSRIFSTTHQYLDDNPTATPHDNYTISVRVLDDDAGASPVTTTTVTVKNVPPSAVVIAPPAMIDENGVATLDLTFTDPGMLDAHQVEVDWGDGSAVEVLTVAAGSRMFSTTHQYPDDNPTGTPQDIYTISVRVLDDDAGASAVTTTTVTVKNVPPNGIIVAPAAVVINEGGQASLDLSFTDPGSLDTHSYVIDWGDGTSTAGTVVAGGRTFAGSHTYADNGDYTVKVTVTDDDDGVGMTTSPVKVANVDPVLTVVANQTINEGALLSLVNVGTFTDPGFNNPLNTLDPGNGGETSETFTYTIDWGDGTALSAGAATIDQAGAIGVPTSGSFDGSHTYADNGTYTVTVTVLDDDGGQHARTFTVTVANIDPTLTGTANLTVDEGQGFTLSGLGVGVTDPGFDNPANAGNVANGGETAETFTGMDVDWGDGTAVQSITITDRVSGAPGTPTTALVTHPTHTYADNGTYTVTIRLSDDDGAVVTRTLTIVVDNVAPTLTLTGDSFTISEGDTLSLPALGSFTDPGFDNAANAGNVANGGEASETFTYTIDWGDGTIETLKLPATRTSGSPGVLTVGTLADLHTYADNDADNTYTITVTLTDDDGASDVKQFNITVLNVNPTLDPITATDVTSGGQTTLQLNFSDPGADSFEVLVDWGDKLNLPPDQRFVVETVHAGSTPQSFTLTHLYTGPPDPLNPSADIVITVKIRDDDFGTLGVVEAGQSNLESVTIANPGINDNAIRIDTSPKVPLLTFQVRPADGIVATSSQTSLDSDDEGEIEGSAGEARVTGERFLELVIINPDGSPGPRYRLPPEVLSRLSDFVRKLPDNHYAIYLVQAETDVRRLVIEVHVRDGRLIDPGDDSEGARDLPPSDESQSTPASAGEDAAIESAIDAIDGSSADDPDASDDGAMLPHTLPRSPAMLRHGAALAGVALCLSAAGRSCRDQVDQSLAKAQSQQRKKLKTLGHWPRRPKPR